MSASFPILFTLGSIFLVSAVSLVGVALAGIKKNAIERGMLLLISFAVGGLLGDVFLHILPELAEDADGGFPSASPVIAGGILLSFILEKVIRWRHCHTLDCPTHVRPLGTIALVGDAAHNLTDGILIASSYLVDVHIGIATTIAVLLHEIPQEIGDFAILLHSGYTKSRALLYNGLTALASFVGAAVVLVLQSSVADLARVLLPLVAGNFLYIAVADLLPELHKQTRAVGTLLQLLGIALGLALMFSLTLLA